MDDESIKKNIIIARKKLRMTQKDVADRLGITRNSYRRIECGDTVLTNSYIHKLAEILDMSDEELVLGYVPYRLEPGLNDVRREYISQLRHKEEEHKKETKELKQTIEDLKYRTGLLEEIIKAKEEMISMLKGRGND